MRIAKLIAGALAFGLGLGIAAGPAAALDGIRAPGASPAPTPLEAFRSGTRALRDGEMDKGVNALEYAAGQGHMPSQWKLGRMYADGDQVKKDDLRAFEYFSRIANSHADDSPERPQSRFVANAFVALGQYYLAGIPNTAVRADPNRAREMFWYAASYFGDADAQYSLARMIMDGKGAARDPRRAAQWLQLAAEKGQNQAQALLGHMLFEGEHVPRQAARGLMWLTLARDGTAEKWIKDMYDAAVKQASRDELTMAGHYLSDWMMRGQGRRR